MRQSLDQFEHELRTGGGGRTAAPGTASPARRGPLARGASIVSTEKRGTVGFVTLLIALTLTVVVVVVVMFGDRSPG